VADNTVAVLPYKGGENFLYYKIFRTKIQNGQRRTEKQTMKKAAARF
jgi:hypothetical protein